MENFILVKLFDSGSGKMTHFKLEMTGEGETCII